MRPYLLAGLLAALLGVAVGTAAEIRATLFNSDILLPIAWFHDLLADPANARTFELPRVPSLFPDLLALGLLVAALPWRLAMLAWVAAAAASLVLLGGAIAARWAGRPATPALAWFGAMAAAALLADLQFDHAWGGFFPALFPVNHAGSLFCTLGGFLLAARLLRSGGAGTGAALAGLCAAAVLSDRLFLVTGAGPVVVGALARTGPPRRVAMTIALVVAGCVAGWALDHAVFPGLLVRQPDLPISLEATRSHLPALLADPHLAIEGAGALFACVVPTLWAWRSAAGRFWWACGAAACLASLAVQPLAYWDWGAVRYMQVVWWWPLVVGAAAAARFLPPRLPFLALALAGAAASVLAVLRRDLLDVPAVAAWRDPVATCLADLPPGTVHAGLAAFWTARPVAAASDWALPVAPVLGNGTPYAWGNNRRDYAMPHDFIVMAQLEPAAIAARFGQPDRRVPCPGSEVWLYRDPARIAAGLLPIDPATGRLAGPAAFPPPTLSSRAGPLPADGTVPATTLRQISTWGPYAPLSPGRWRVVLRYDFAGRPDPLGWEASAAPDGPVLASGPLVPGTGQVLSTTIDMVREPHLLEIRTYTGPGDRLVVSGLVLCPATSDASACETH